MGILILNPHPFITIAGRYGKIRSRLLLIVPGIHRMTWSHPMNTRHNQQ